MLSGHENYIRTERTRLRAVRLTACQLVYLLYTPYNYRQSGDTNQTFTTTMKKEKTRQDTTLVRRSLKKTSRSSGNPPVAPKRCYRCAVYCTHYVRWHSTYCTMQIACRMSIAHPTAAVISRTGVPGVGTTVMPKALRPSLRTLVTAS